MEDINSYIDLIWSKLISDDVPSDFGNVTYYGLLKDTLLIVKRLYSEWIVKDETFNKQIETTIELLNSATDLLNSINTSVEQVESSYKSFTEAITNQQNAFENKINTDIEAIKNDISTLIKEYINTPEFEALLTAKVDEILQGAGFETLVQNIIAKTTIEFSKVNVSGYNADSFISAMSSNGALLRKSSVSTNRTMEKDLIFNNGIGINFKDNTNVLALLLYLTTSNVFIVGSDKYSMQLKSKSRPNILVGSTPQTMAFYTDLANYVNRATPSIPTTSTFKIGERTAISSNSSNNIVTFGDFDYPLYLAVKDINSRPKMYTKTGTSFDLSTKNDVTSEVTKQVNSLLNKIYHVGRIIETLDPDFNPNTIIGTWEQFGAGRVTVGVDTNNPIMNEAGKTFGENEHTLTENEMPIHKHNGINNAKFVTTGSTGNNAGLTQGGGAYVLNTSTSNAGGGQPHNNMQASISVYRWIRVS